VKDLALRFFGLILAFVRLPAGRQESIRPQNDVLLDAYNHAKDPIVQPSDLSMEGRFKRPSSGHSLTSTRAWLEVGDIMTPQAAVISAEESVVEAARKMAEKKISCLVVMKDDCMQGIITETDLLRKVAGSGGKYDQKVADVLTPSVQGINVHASIFEASGLMGRRKIKRLPVLDGERLVGIVTQTDLTRALAAYEMWHNVGEIMTPDVLTVMRGTAVEVVARQMSERGVSCAVVKEGESAAGIFTTRDLVGKVISRSLDIKRTRIEEVMTSPVETVPKDASVLNVVKLMESKRIRRVVVAHEGKMCGIVTQTDVFRAVKNKLETEERENFELLEKSDLGIYILDLKNKITYANPALLKLLEVEVPSQLVGHAFLPPRFLAYPEEQETLEKSFASGGEANITELALRTAKNRPIFVTLFSSASKNAHGEVNGSQGFVQDVTEKRELVAVKEASHALEVHNQLLRDMVNMKTEVIDMVVHDLKNPLAVNHGGITLLLDGLLGEVNPKQRKMMEDMKDALERLLRLVHDLLDVSRLESGKIELDRAEFEAVPMARKLLAGLQIIASKKGLTLEVEDAVPGLKIYADEDRFAQVLTNLVGNAMKFTQQGKVTVGFIDREKETECFVADTGPGIPEEKIPLLFERFRQLGHHGSGTAERGTGLGLSIASGIVGLHGGRIWVESKEGRGARFVFTIPKAG
jgi:PAS domain S-box-containing protein